MQNPNSRRLKEHSNLLKSTYSTALRSAKRRSRQTSPKRSNSVACISFLDNKCMLPCITPEISRRTREMTNRLPAAGAGTLHLAISPTVFCGVVSLEYASLRLVGLGEGVSALFAHALDLSDFSDGLLELLHSVNNQYCSHRKRIEIRTLACNLGCCTSGSPGYGGRSWGSTFA